MSLRPWVSVGYVSGVYGVRGWIKVFSYTRPRERILDYQPWYLARDASAEAPLDAAATGVTGRLHGRSVVAKLDGIDDRDAAAALIGRGILVAREALPETAPGEYYWSDLIGLAVRGRSGELLGTVTGLLETGANDVLVLDGSPQRLIPFVPGRVVEDVDPERREITVDWAADWWE